MKRDVILIVSVLVIFVAIFYELNQEIQGDFIDSIESRQDPQIIDSLLIRRLELVYGYLSENAPRQSQNSLRYDEYHLGLRNNPEYCLKSDALRLQQPQYQEYEEAQKIRIFTDHTKNSLLRQIFRKYYSDSIPGVHLGMQKELYNSRIYDFPTDIDIFFTQESKFLHFHRLGSNAVCLLQLHSQIPGKISITMKDLVIDNYVYYKTQNPNIVDYHPETYRLYNRQECLNFFVQIVGNSIHEEKLRKQGPQFISKFGRDLHKGKGVKVLFGDQEDDLKAHYQQGRKCGQESQILIIQRYVSNPLLYKNHKIEFRIYYLIASTDPLIIYTYRKVHVKKCAEQYDKFSRVRESHICNTALMKGKFDSPDPNVEKIVDWGFEKLQEILREQNLVPVNSNYTQEVLIPQIDRMITHHVLSGQFNLYKDSRFFELFAIDFILDSELKINFLENNFNPEILAVSKGRQTRHEQMFQELVEIQMSYLRARRSRIQQLFSRTNLTETEFRELFLQANKNYLNPQDQLNLTYFQQIYPPIN